MCNHSLSLNLSITDSEFTKKIDKVNQLTSEFETVIHQIKLDTQKPLESSTELKKSVLNDNVMTFLNETDVVLLSNQTRDLLYIHEMSNETLQKFTKINDEVALENLWVNLKTIYEIKFLSKV